MATRIQYHFKEFITVVHMAVVFSSLLACAGGGSNTPYPVINADKGNKLIFYEDFEKDNYKDNWFVHWNSPAGAGTVITPSPTTGVEGRSAYTVIKKGAHSAIGSGEYVPQTPIGDIAFLHINLKLQDNFSMGTSRVMKMFAIKGGARIENAYGGAGRRPNGKDKLSVTLAVDNWRELFIYYYHPDQRTRYGDNQYSNQLFGGYKLSPGRWYCLELMVKLNTPGQRDGEIISWLDGQLAIWVKKIRFRDTDIVKIRRFTFVTYFGGALASDTSPKDQRVYMDNIAISRKRIGCKPAGQPD